MHARTIQRVKETQVNLWDMHAYNYCSEVDKYMAQLIYVALLVNSAELEISNSYYIYVAVEELGDAQELTFCCE